MFDLTDDDVSNIITALERTKGYFTDKEKIEDLIQYLSESQEDFSLGEADGKLDAWGRNEI